MTRADSGIGSDNLKNTKIAQAKLVSDSIALKKQQAAKEINMKVVNEYLKLDIDKIDKLDSFDIYNEKLNEIP